VYISRLRHADYIRGTAPLILRHPCDSARKILSAYKAYLTARPVYLHVGKYMRKHPNWFLRRR